MANEAVFFSSAAHGYSRDLAQAMGLPGSNGAAIFGMIRALREVIVCVEGRRNMSSQTLTQTRGTILNVYNEGANRIGLVEFDGKRRTIYLNLVPEAQPGDDVWFYAGFAIERVDGSPETEDREPDVKALQAYRLLSELEPGQLRKLLPLARDKHFAAGQIIFRSGEQSLFLHLIVSGDVALDEAAGDPPVTLQTLHAGDAMGWSAIAADASTHFQARALSLVRTLAFQGDEIRNAFDQDPAMGYTFMKRLMELLTERLDALRTKSAERVSRPG